MLILISLLVKMFMHIKLKWLYQLISILQSSLSISIPGKRAKDESSVSYLVHKILPVASHSRKERARRVRSVTQLPEKSN